MAVPSGNTILLSLYVRCMSGYASMSLCAFSGVCAPAAVAVKVSSAISVFFIVCGVRFVLTALGCI